MQKFAKLKFPARLQIQSRRTTDRRHSIGVLNAQLPGAGWEPVVWETSIRSRWVAGNLLPRKVSGLFTRAERQATRRGINFRETRRSERTGEYREHSWNVGGSSRSCYNGKTNDRFVPTRVRSPPLCRMDRGFSTLPTLDFRNFHWKPPPEGGNCGKERANRRGWCCDKRLDRVV